MFERYREGEIEGEEGCSENLYGEGRGSSRVLCFLPADLIPGNISSRYVIRGPRGIQGGPGGMSLFPVLQEGALCLKVGESRSLATGVSPGPETPLKSDPNIKARINSIGRKHSVPV